MALSLKFFFGGRGGAYSAPNSQLHLRSPVSQTLVSPLSSVAAGYVNFR